MFIWAGFDIAHTIRNRELNRSEINKKIQAEMVKETYRGQFGGDAVEGGTQAIGQFLDRTSETSPTAIAHTLEGLSHLLHH
ncbi:hypothetical protein QUA81_19825 [Microcoleus sp. F6_B4]